MIKYGFCNPIHHESLLPMVRFVIRLGFIPEPRKIVFFGGKNAGLRFYYSINGGKQTQDEKIKQKRLDFFMKK